MYKILYLIIFISLFATSVYAQTTPPVNLSEKDSLEVMNQLANLLNMPDSPVSYVFANVGIGNRLFSIKNNALNAFQSAASRMIYSPSIGYFHKTGFGLSAGANLLNEGAGLSVNQYSISPSFDLTGNKNIGFDISYTHYFVKNKYSQFSSPVQNDFYTSLRYKKSWLQPGIALGYATGEYKEAKYKDTIIGNNKKRFYDSINYNLTAFSVLLSASHQFTWYHVLDKSDGLGFTTTLMLNAGSGKTSISHKSNAVALFNFLNKRGRVPKLETNKFEAQSVGLNMELDYTIGNFTFEPQFYIDYYLPASDATTKRVTQLFTFNVGYTF
jgi:hypothetical protein